MKSQRFFTAVFAASVVLAMLVGSTTIADTSTDSPSADQPAMPLPPGWTAEDMEAVTSAATPGKMHEHLAQDVGKWSGETTMWMYPGAESTTSQCTYHITPLMDGRYIKMEMAGEMPGMGSYTGLAISGFDNVSQQFVSTWIDDLGTGIANGTGELSSDGNTLTWNYTYNCPLTKKQVVLREVDTITGPNTKTLEMFGADPKTGQEFKMMHIELTKK